ncbi:MAG: class A beta-lactamase-related serine hydrolase [Deltaproteobacteria bacterium]|nr:MAG: class A beta-lactamase-related serine hydrolase [Deltaproteobacteria bacterium]
MVPGKAWMAQARFRRVDDLMNLAVARGVFCGAQLLVEIEGRTVHSGCYGRTSYWPWGLSVDHGTCFDLASLTKPLATACVMMKLVENGVVSLDWPVGRWFPRAACRDVPLWRLLDHTAGLEDWWPFFHELAPAGAGVTIGKRKELVLNTAAEIGLKHMPGERELYSDLGYIIACGIIERAAGATLDDIFESYVAERIGSCDIFFPAGRRTNRVYAATELCPWRLRVICGEVHDENCWFMGGVSGHAGLFGTAEAVARLANQLLQAWPEAGACGESIFAPGIVERFLAPEKTGQRFRLGFDTPAESGSQAGNLLSRKSIGHLGFTGTSFWIDPERRLVVVLLTNRVHPGRDNEEIKRFRPELHDLVVEEVDG